MTERTFTVRHSGFQAAIWVTVIVIVVFSPLLLIGLGWFLEPFEEVEGAAPVSHRVHEISFGILFALALVGALTQRRSPRDNIAGMQQLIVVTAIFTVVMWRSVDRFEWLSVLYLVPVATAAVLHPDRRRLLWPPPRPLWAGLLLTWIALTPLVEAAGREFARAAAGAQDHTTHWGAMAAFFLTLLALSLVTSVRPPGHEVTAVSVGGGVALYGFASLLFPFDASAHPSAWAVLAIGWGSAWIALAVWLPDRSSETVATTRLTRTALRALRAVAVGMAGLLLGFVWAGGDDPPNIPHSLDTPLEQVSPATCQICHGTGQNGAPDVPHDFPLEGQTSCLACHRYNPALIAGRIGSTLGVSFPLSGEVLTGEQLRAIRGQW